MIPDEAVEAAARRFAALAGYDWDKKWDTTEDVEADVRADIRRQAREILEAAAPRLMAGAWDEGAKSQADSYGMDVDTKPNPYRKTTK